MHQTLLLSLCKKLKNLRYALKHWSKGVSRLSALIDNSNKAILELDGIEEKRVLTGPEANFRIVLKRHLITLLDYKKLYWKKRCTIRQFKFGDRNTKFFHGAATERFCRNSIASLRLPDNSIVQDHVGKEAVLFQTYKDRLGRSDPVNISLNLRDIIKCVEGLDELTAPFSREEIDCVVKEMLADRTPGPDSFTGCFLKACWHIVKEDF